MTQFQTPDGIQLVYETFGLSQHPAVILIMGLGAQMRVWPDELCQRLAGAGYYVVRFDNRDVGDSTHLNDQGSPSLLKTWLQQKMQRQADVPYTLHDMSRDVLALLDQLQLDNAHLIGASMGGMIAQILAATKRKRVRSLTSIMSAGRAPGLPDPNLKVLLQLAKRPTPFNREASVRYTMRMNRLIGSPAYPMDEMELRQLAETSFDRAGSPCGFKRQLVAITAAGDRRHLLQKIKVPTLVIHGSDDPLIPARMGADTAAAIRKAKLKIIQGMGHDLPPALVPKLSKMLIKHLNKSERKWHKRTLKRAAQNDLKNQPNNLIAV
ncbi:alpha/beta fold hydrolase [Bacterioplanoides sp.]|uniref:alpha/beta fold hydrolase n=1 Tax=Bacterioplanoides sp. TaxID=2066072 RepID=UPI003AFFF8CD